MPALDVQSPWTGIVLSTGAPADSARFTAVLDARGRILIPAAVREHLGIGRQDTVRVRIETVQVETYAVDGYSEALERLQDLDDVNAFSYRNGELEVVLDGR